jgi:hypothetical protein
MDSILKSMQSDDVGKAQGTATEAHFRAELTGTFSAAQSHDPYNGTHTEPGRHVKLTDLRELSRQIQLRRANKKGQASR